MVTRVLHINNIASIGYGLCKTLNEYGIEADLICRPSRSIGGKEEWIHTVKGRLNELKLNKIKINEYDIIHCHYLTNFLSLSISLRNIDKPIILHAHGTDTRPQNILRKIWQRYVASKGDTLIYSTPDLQENLTWFKGEKIYLPNFSILKKENLEAEKYENRVLIHARLTKNKQFEKLFLLIKDLKLNFDLFKIGPAIHYYMEYTPDNITFIEPVPHTKIPTLLEHYKLILGRQDGSIGVSELEAMSLGIPTLFPFNYNEFYEKPLPMPEMTSQNILGNFGNYKLGEKQKNWVDEYHNIRKVTKRLIEIYARKLDEI